MAMLPQSTVIFRGPRVRLLGALRFLPRMLAGRVSDPTGEVRILLTRVGLAALGVIRDAFLVRARGGTDASGMVWKPLEPETIAARRAGPGGKRGKVEILRDTGRLFASLGPALPMAGTVLVGRTVPGQMLVVKPGSVSVGTNVKYGKYHHLGTGSIPKRPLWPDWTRWPAQWRRRVYDQYEYALADLLIRLATRIR